VVSDSPRSPPPPAGQAWSPGFLITNAFGGVLDAKHAAETRLRTSGLDYVIVRPADRAGGMVVRVGGVRKVGGARNHVWLAGGVPGGGRCQES